MKKKMIWICLLVLLISSLTQGAERNVSSDFNDPSVTIGVLNGSSAMENVKEQMPEATLSFYPDFFLGYTDLLQGNIDALAYDRIKMERAIQGGQMGVRILPDNLEKPLEIGIGISRASKIPDLKEKISACLDDLRAKGTLDDMFRRWAVDYLEEMPEIPLNEESDLHLVVGTTGVNPPFSYYQKDQLTGYDIELGKRLGAYLGASVEFKVYDPYEILMAAVTGEVDCIAANLNITPERQKSIDFSQVLYESPSALMVKDPTAPTKAPQELEPGAQAESKLQEESAPASQSQEKIQDYNDKNIIIGVSIGTAAVNTVAKELPNAKVSYYTDYILASMDVASGKIDAFANDRLVMREILNNGLKGVHLLSEEFQTPLEIGVGLSRKTRIPNLEEKINQFIDEKKEDGTIEEMFQRWYIDHEDTIPPISLPETSDLHLVVGTTGVVPIASYYVGNKITGFDIELSQRLASWLGSTLEFKFYDFNGVVAAATSGEVDCILSSLHITEDRKKSIDFSHSYLTIPIALLVRDTGESASPVQEDLSAQEKEIEAPNTLSESLISSFDKTFLTEERWMLFLTGVENTLKITLLSIFFGVLLGFCAYMLCRKGKRLPNLLTNLCVTLIQGTPLVVLLMILYYIIFSSVSIDGLWVSIIGFTLIFGSAFYLMLKNGIATVDRGQFEAAYALGNGEYRTFFKLILPQALPVILPQFQGQVNALIKSTSIVGYITVLDLTKAGDIVRNRTYEAFFPLIAVGIMYFILEGTFHLLILYLSRKLDNKNRKKEHILRGIKP